MGASKIRWFNKRQTRSDPVAIWLNGDEARDIICPAGYTPLNKNEEVRKCTHKIADLVSSMTIMLMENGSEGDVRLKNELSKKIDIYPNKYMTRKNFIYKTVHDMILNGNGNSIVYPKIINGLIDNLEIWDMKKVTFDCKDDSYIIKYNNVPFNPDEVLHFVLIPDDDRPFIGQGFASSLKETISNLLQANATKTGFLRSKWKPSLIIKVESDSEDLINRETRNRILESYTGDSEAGKPWLIPASEIDVKEVRPLTLQDLAIQDSITLDKKAVASSFGIPAFMVGVGEFDKDEYNNFISTVIMPIAQNIQQELTRKLVYSPNWYFKFNPKSLMQYDLKDLTDMTTKMVAAGMLNRNEGRSEFGYAPVEGLNEYIVLENYIPVNKVGEQKKLKGGNGAEQGQTEY